MWQDVVQGRLELPCDVVELRVDGLPPEITPADILAAPCPRPLLVTVRDQAEGGLRPMSLAERAAWAAALLPAAAMLDWEIANLAAAPALVEQAHAAGVRIVASAHDFQKTPAVAYMQERERLARSLGADIAKFAFRLNDPQDMQAGLDLLAAATGPMAVMGMGPDGPASRLLYSRRGSCLVYGYLGNAPTAPGQLSAAELRRALQA